MVEWFWRRRGGAPAIRLRSREESQPALRIDLQEFAPEPVAFLARAAYVELTLSEAWGRAVSLAPATGQKVVLAAAQAQALDRYRAFLQELEATGADPAIALDQRREFVDRFIQLTAGQDWAEAALTCHLAGGFFGDLFRALAAGLPKPLPARVLEICTKDNGTTQLFLDAMNDQPRLPARLALWGRRVLGDVLLVARDSLAMPVVTADDERRIEPAFSELVAEHSRRMDALGLSA